MNSGQYVLSQLLDGIHREQFHRCVNRYGGDYKAQTFSTWQQFVCLVFAQLTWRESLRDIEACLNSRADQLYHLGLRGPVKRSTLADALASRDWRIFADLAQLLIQQARKLYASEPIALDLKQTIYALDASIIDLCLSVYPWARFDALRSGIKIHTQLELHSHLPAQILVSLATFQEVVWLDQLTYEPGAFYLMDRAYVDWRRLYAIEQARAWFVVRAKKPLRCCRLHSQPVNVDSGLRSDQIISLQAFYAAKKYPDKLRRVRFYDVEHQRALVFLTNHFGLPALTVARLYQQRWQVGCSFAGSNNICESKRFTAPVTMPCGRNCGWPCASMPWSPFSKNGWAAMPRSTKFSKFSASAFSRKRPWRSCFKHFLLKMNQPPFLNSCHCSSNIRTLVAVSPSCTRQGGIVDDTLKTGRGWGEGER